MSDDVPQGDFAPLAEALIDWRNERFLKDLSREVKRGLQDLARQGYAPGGFPPRGYKAEKVTIGVKRDGRPHVVSQWIPDPELAPAVQKALEMQAAGASYKETHDATQVMGSLGSYVTMFRNKTYLGIRKCGELEIEDAHEALMDRKTWDTVQAVRRSRVNKGRKWPKGDRHPRRTRSPYLLSGFARCAVCGAAMVSGRDNISGNRKTPWRFYLCGRKQREGWHSCPRGRIGAEGPEQAAVRKLMEKALRPSFVEACVAGLNKRLAEDTPDSLEARIRGAQKRLEEVERSINVLLDLAEQFGAASAGPRLLEPEAQRERVRAQLERLNLQKETGQGTVSPQEVRSLLAEMREAPTSGDIRVQREPLSKVLVKVTMDKTAGHLTYTFPLHQVTGKQKVPKGPRAHTMSPPLLG